MRKLRRRNLNEGCYPKATAAVSAPGTSIDSGSSADSPVGAGDKKKPKEVEVPLDIAREAVQVGYYSAHAQLCNLMEEQQANYQTLMARQRDANWTDQQKLYIQKLHQATVMIMTGKIKFVESEGNLKPVQRDAKTNVNEPCTDAKRQNVKAQIASYINASPKAKTAEPAKAATQKK